jgi:hypothetical protein
MNNIFFLNTMTPTRISFFLLFLLSCSSSAAFLRSLARAGHFFQLYSDLDGIGSMEDDDGAVLAKEFYEQLKKRQEGVKNMETNDRFDTYTAPDPSGSVRSEEMLNEREARELNQQAFSRRREVVAGIDVGSKKFTGQQSAGFFSGNGPSVYSVPLDRNRNSSKQRMRQNEFNLATRGEQSILIQGGIALVMLAFFAYIGFTGGIEANSAIGGIDPTSIEGMETMMPVPTDTEKTFWL